jgi:hypothetical protein
MLTRTHHPRGVCCTDRAGLKLVLFPQSDSYLLRGGLTFTQNYTNTQNTGRLCVFVLDKREMPMK